MQCEWLGERVATVDVARAVAGVVTGREDAGWGPNAVFRFPLHGGTGAIWRGVSRLLPRRKQARSRSHRVAWGGGAHSADMIERDIVRLCLPWERAMRSQ